MKIHPSIQNDLLYKESATENNGLSLIDDSVLSVYCPGISTCGFAEISMALNNSKRRIVATTIDAEGLTETQKLVEKYQVGDQISVKIEDVSKPLPYADESFDFIYARLVLHYLPKIDLTRALQELHRILNTGRKLFVVVRSFDWISEVPEQRYDPETGMTSYPKFDESGKVIDFINRNLQTIDSITEYLSQTGFTIVRINKIEELIYGGYLRTRPNIKPALLIEAVAIK